MIKGYIFDYGATLDTAGQHWGKVLWHAYERQQVPVMKPISVKLMSMENALWAELRS